MLLNDEEINRYATEHGLIDPANYVSSTQRSTTNTGTALSYGLGPFGYDVRLSEDVYLFCNLTSTIIDPKAFDADCLVKATLHDDHDGNGVYVLIPPNSYMLGKTVERISMPDDLSAICLGKSTMARCGLMINTTPVWAGFIGEVVLEAANVTTLPMKAYVNEGFSTLMFFKGNPAMHLYNGLYQNQSGVTFAKT